LTLQSSSRHQTSDIIDTSSPSRLGCLRLSFIRVLALAPTTVSSCARNKGVEGLTFRLPYNKALTSHPSSPSSTSSSLADSLQSSMQHVSPPIFPQNLHSLKEKDSVAPQPMDIAERMIALKQKEAAAQCWTDVAFWGGGVVPSNQVRNPFSFWPTMLLRVWDLEWSDWSCGSDCRINWVPWSMQASKDSNAL